VDDGSIAKTNIIGQVRKQIRQVMWQYVSLCRDQEGLLQAKRELEDLRSTIMETAAMGYKAIPAWIETMNMLTVAELVILAALQRQESRGSHWRRDFDASDEALAGCHFVFQRGESDLEKTIQSSSRQELVTHA
jgi:succinate dehydrogenase/fumarate reductase flavoprotein subunit